MSCPAIMQHALQVQPITLHRGESIQTVERNARSLMRMLNDVEDDARSFVYYARVHIL